MTPVLGTLDHAVLLACTHQAGSSARWDQRRRAGADDFAILEALGVELGGCLTRVRNPGGGLLHCIGGPRPQLWFRVGTAGPPTLQGRELARYARLVLDIPRPAGRPAGLF